MEKLDLILQMQQNTRGDIKNLDRKFDHLDGKVESYILSTEGRLTKVESRLSLRSRIGGAIAVLLPAIATALYFLIPS